MNKFISNYKNFILETELKHIAIGSLSRLSAFTMLVLYVKMLIKLNLSTNMVEDEIPIYLNSVNDDYIEDISHLQSYLQNNIFILAKNANIDEKKLKGVLSNKPYYYIYYTATGMPSIFMASAINFKPLSKDIVFNPGEFYIKPDIKRATELEMEDFLYSNGYKIQPYLDNYWIRKVNENPSIIKQAEKEMSKEGLKKFKHLGSQFGLFD